MKKLNYLHSEYLDFYKKKQPITLLKHFNRVKQSNDGFDFYFSNSAVFSSMIEGNIIDFDSYLKYSHSGMNNTGKSFKEIEDLKNAYKFAKSNKLTLTNLLKTHKIATRTVIENPKYRGVLRDKNVYIFSDGKKKYTGAVPGILKSELTLLFKDIKILLARDLTLSEVFYYASMIHLAFVQIHPFADGNGRASRLIEKWFLAQKLGEKAWCIQSERLYQKLIRMYYKNVDIGDNYATIDYDLSIPFLLMLPMALKLSK